MPLLFESQGQIQAKGNAAGMEDGRDVGHFMLGVAEVVLPADEESGETGIGKTKVKEKSAKESEVTRVHIKTYDSSPGHVRPEDIRKKSRKLVTDSKWLGNLCQPQFNPSKTVHVPSQEMAANTCGLHTVLNAWAVMLNIPIHDCPQRRGRTTSGAFQRMGLEIVNLALAGCMRSITIQAFLNVYGYSTDQDPNNPEHTVIKCSTTRMDHDKLDRCMLQQRDSDRQVAWKLCPHRVDLDEALTRVIHCRYGINTSRGTGCVDTCRL